MVEDVALVEAPQTAEEEHYLISMVTMKMPYGKYEGWLVCDLPEAYLSWYQKKGFPGGKLGNLMATMYEIKLNGLEYLITPIRNAKA